MGASAPDGEGMAWMKVEVRGLLRAWSWDRLVGVESGRDAATGGADGTANAQWHRDSNTKQASLWGRKDKHT